MKTASVREVQHHLSRILEWVEDGEEVTLTKNKRIVAKIVPMRNEAQPVKTPDFAARLKRLFPQGPPPGKPLSQIVDEGRGEKP